MATTLSIINQSLRALGVNASGEAASDPQVQDALEIGNQLLASWSNNKLLLPAQVHENFTLTGAASYTIGVGGDIDTAWPLAIQHARIKESGGVEYPVDVFPMDTWSDTVLKNFVSNIPHGLYYNPTYPLGTIYFSAIPETGNLLKLISDKPLSSLPALTTETTYPPGYERAIRLGLAMELVPEYPEHNPNTVLLLATQLDDALKVIKHQNSIARTRGMRVDSALTTGEPYSILTGPGR